MRSCELPRSKRPAWCAWSTGRRRLPLMASSSSARLRFMASGWRPASALMGSPGPAAWAASSLNGSSTGSRDWTPGRWTRGGSAATTRVAITRWRGLARCTRPITTSSIPATSAAPAGRCASHLHTRGCKSSAACSARSRAGSAPTGSSPMPSAATNPCVPEDGPGASGRPLSGPSTTAAVRLLRCSTSHRSRRSRCEAAARRNSSSASPTIASRGLSEP